MQRSRLLVGWACRPALVVGLVVGGVSLSASLAVAQDSYEQTYAKVVAEWAKADEGLDYAGASGKGDEAYKNARVAINLAKLAETDDQKKKAEADAKAAEVVALKFYKIALGKAPEETDENRDALNEIRDRVAYLTYSAQMFDEAAAVSEYLCRKHPANQYALHCAQIATASLLQNYNKANGEEKGKALVRLVGLTVFMADQWKGKPEGDEALGRLGQYAMAAGDVNQAKSIMERMPKDSEHRYSIQLKLAQGMWFEYVTKMAKPEAERPKDLDKLKEEAKQGLRQSTEWLRSKIKNDKVDYQIVAAELSLVQIYNQLGEYENAKKLLDIPKSGLLTLALLNLEVLRQGTVNLREEIYKAALRTFLGLKDYARAEQTVNELSKVGGKGLDAAGVTKMFAGLAKQVLDEVTEMRKAKAPPAEVSAKLEALVGLCEKVAERKEGHTFGSLSWPAETLYKQGEIVAETGETPAAPLFAKAVVIYQTLLDRAKAEKQFAPDASAVNAVREKLAKCYREQGNQKEALDQFRALLKEFPKQITSQVEAARTYQALGKASKDTGAAFDAFDNAIKGSDPVKDAKGGEANAIWGWAKISLMTQSSPQNKDLFHEARYNLALCKLLQGNLYQESDKKKAKDLFQLAERDLHATYVLTKDMGGPEWQAKYDKLLKGLQEMQGKEPTGLPKKGESGAIVQAETKESQMPVAAKPQPSGGLAVANMPLLIGLLVVTGGMFYGGWVWMQAAAKARRQKALRR